MSPPVWFITAASSGFGKEIALNALKKGDRVIATGRSLSKLAEVKEAGAKTYALDVTSDLNTIKKIVAEAHAKYGRLDILVNSAGYILEAAIEEASPKESFDVFNTNVFGTLNVTRAVLPYMRTQRSGVIALFGSLGSWTGGPAFGLYAGTKWACSGLAESLKPEVAPFGIDVTVIEPGYFRSGFLNPGARILSAERIQEYEESAVGYVRGMLQETDGKQPGDVKKGCDVIVDVLTKRGVAEGREIPLRLVLGTDCQAAIREKLESTAKLLDDWQEIGASTDYPKES
ncbi:NAD(P)-binding Rossmann-fold containing protein [Glarea lozoyensis ATCC 20868]|uniref:NAD(P)-binding Rossmann-fold containing protein n=1 Tax=Glarea lozoyensis (strain ATCC 20868 / MF5171) TaxID=1116229 RepID=S3D4F8_GLAL2|nr:NAD(P)-binding Rossmann-fold containing protein [Glarea lozoyensis ATCC 20868]EPE33312.1 NAD(P)-binding Rossmann-fold containing protein [Glarea lozoyensis ATCC 20868]